MLRHQIRSAAALLVGGLTVAACGSTGDEGATASKAPTQGVSESEIVIGNYSPQSGPVAVFGSSARVMEAYAKKVNDEGGVNGRKIRFVIRDDQFDPARTVSAVRRLNEQDKAFAICGGVGSSTTKAALPYVKREGIPLVPVGAGAESFTSPTEPLVFRVNPSYTFEGATMASYATSELDAKRIAVFYQNDPVGEEGLAGIRSELDKLGIEPAVTVPYEATETDFSSQAARLRAADPDVVMLFSFPSQTAELRKEAAQIGLETTWLGSLLLADPVMFQLAGEKVWNDTFVMTYQQPPTDTGDPKVQAYLDFMEQYAADETVGATTQNAYGFMQLCVEGLKRAGKDLNRERYLTALESIQGWTESINPEVTLGPDDHAAVERLALMQARDGRYEVISEFQTLEEWQQAGQ